MPRKKPPVLSAAEARKYLAKVPDAVVFWVHDGGVLHDLAELAAALETMSDDTYAHHANAAKNDFVNWVRDVIGDQTTGDRPGAGGQPRRGQRCGADAAGAAQKRGDLI